MAQARNTMATFSGASSGGRRDQPPNKKSKMDAKLSANSADKSSDKDDSNSDPGPDSLYSNEAGCVSSVTDMKLDCLKCEICNDFPRKEVFQCTKGHSVCSGCIVSMTRCPFCRVNYGANKMRSLKVEALLDTLTYNCSYRDEGCLNTKITRNHRTAHEIQCDHNPSTTRFKFCELFNGPAGKFPPGGCQFRVCLNSLIKDPEHIKDVVEHLTSHPHSVPYQKVKYGQKIVIQFRLPSTSYEEPASRPFKLFEVSGVAGGDIIGYYVLVAQVAKTGFQQYVSWSVVGFTCAPPENQTAEHSRNLKIPVKFSIKAKADPGNVARFGVGGVPNLAWTINTEHLNEWKEFISRGENRPPFIFSLTVNFIREYYKVEDDRCEMTVTFG